MWLFLFDSITLRVRPGERRGNPVSRSNKKGAVSKVLSGLCDDL